MIPTTTKLTDGVISLRPMWLTKPSELAEAVRESIPEVMPWMSWCTPDYDEDDAADWLSVLQPSWASKRLYAFAIVDAKRHHFLGGTSLSHINYFYRLCNVGYWVRTSATGRGIAARAARLLCQFGIEQVGLLRAEIVVAVGNKPSLRVAEKVGAKYEGILRNRLVIREKVVDAVMHSLTPQDFGVKIQAKPYQS